MTTFVLPRGKESLSRHLEGLPTDGQWRVEVKPHKAKRSNSQNRLMWLWYDLIRKHIADSTGQLYSADEVHEFMKAKFLPSKIVEIRGEAVRARQSTSALNTSDMSAYLNNIDMYSAGDLGLTLPHPIDIYYEAMGR